MVAPLRNGRAAGRSSGRFCEGFDATTRWPENSLHAGRGCGRGTPLRMAETLTGCQYGGGWGAVMGSRAIELKRRWVPPLLFLPHPHFDHAALAQLDAIAAHQPHAAAGPRHQLDLLALAQHARAARAPFVEQQVVAAHPLDVGVGTRYRVLAGREPHVVLARALAAGARHLLEPPQVDARQR